MKGMVFDIQRFCTHDGPGIRTTVFMKGCTLHCTWCHNPESISPKRELQTYWHKCIGCGACLEVCSAECHRIKENTHIIRRDSCTVCGRCTEVCYAGALLMAGREMEAEEALREIMADDIFYKNSGGGVTFSGGEPLLQADFLSEVMALCADRGIHTAIDTAGNLDFSYFIKVIPHTKLFLYDIKTMDDPIHRQYTGSGNTRILENLRKLDKYGIPIAIRIPVISGVNDTQLNFKQTAAFVAGLQNIREIEMLPYHSLGKGKQKSLGENDREENFYPPGREELSLFASILGKSGVNVKCSGVHLPTPTEKG